MNVEAMTEAMQMSVQIRFGWAVAGIVVGLLALVLVCLLKNKMKLPPELMFLYGVDAPLIPITTLFVVWISTGYIQQAPAAIVVVTIVSGLLCFPVAFWILWGITEEYIRQRRAQQI